MKEREVALCKENATLQRQEMCFVSIYHPLYTNLFTVYLHGGSFLLFIETC